MALVNDSPRVLGNRYEVEDLLGRGGMAEVHRGKDRMLGRTVAIKLLRADLARDPTFQARFRREAQSSAALNHPAIVAVYDTGEDQIVEPGGGVVNLPYIVMEYVEGKTLRDMLAEGHHLSIDAALDITAGVLSALEYSHRIGIVHRDIKPANVMLTPVGDVKVMDFGIARALADASSTMTQTQAVIGTAQYLSPEQARGEQVDTRSDLYSAGCLLYELLTGRPPFVADSPVAVAYQHVREMPIPPSRIVPGIPDPVDRIVMHALAKGRDERYQTAAEFRADVEAVRGGRQVNVAVPAVSMTTGSQATTQYVPTADGTGTRLAPVGALGGGLLGADPSATGTMGAPYDPYATNQYGGGRPAPPERSNRNLILAALAALVVIIVVGFLVLHTINKNNDAAATSSMPNVVGQAQNQALETLTQQGFTATPTIQQVSSSQDESGKVVAQNPSATSKVDKSVAITLQVGKGPDSVTVQNVAGKSQDDAEQTLEAQGFKIGSIKEIVDPTQKAGNVSKTDPAAGDSASPGDTITIYVAADTSTIPSDLIGQDYAAARSELIAAGLKVSEKKVTDESPAGTVLQSSPTAGTVVKRGSTVTLTVAKAPVTSTPTESPTPTPTLSSTPTPTATNPFGQ